jgi:hypothetical protein
MNATSILSDELKSAYAFHKRRSGTRARDALEFARVDVAAGKKRYTSMRDVVNASQNDPGAANSNGARWFPKPEACGFRERGAAHDIAPRAVDHTGWFVDPFYDGLCFGLVFLLPGQDGHARAYPAIRFNNTDGTIIYLRNGERIESRHGEIDDGDFHDIAMRADCLAERAAEDEREHQQAWQAGKQWSENRDEMKGEAKELRKLRAALRELPASMDVARAAIESSVAKSRRSLKRLWTENAELKNGNWYARDFSLQFDDCDADMRLAFNEGADRNVLQPLKS